MSTLQKNSDWLYISPVYHLEISKDVNRELTVGRVIFVDIKKLQRIRKRIGLPIVLSKIDKKIPGVSFFKESKTYAIIQFRGIPEQKELECRELIENAIAIISSSQLGYCNRDNNSQFGIIKTRGTGNRFFINKNKFEAHLNRFVESKVLPFRLDKRWKEFHKQFYFFDLLKLISTNNKMQKKWKETIIRAARMSGKSMQSRDLEYSFLWNMIIVEMLLTEQGDKFLDVFTSVNKPYGLHRSRDEKYFKGEKIFSLRKCSVRPRFTYTDFDAYVNRTFMVIKTNRINQKYLTGILNSNLIAFWLKYKGKMQGNNYQIDKTPLENLPLISPNVEVQEKIADLVTSIISNIHKKLDYQELLDKAKMENNFDREILLTKKTELIQANLTTTESEINDTINKLYDLTDDDIAIVENV